MEKKKYIEELYKLYSDEMYHNITLEKEYNKVTNKIENDFERLCTKLNEEEQKLLDILFEDYNERSSIVNKYSFRFGYSIAIKLFVEGLQEDIHKNNKE